MQPAPFPAGRPRRLRGSRVVRELVREHQLSHRDLVAPLFVKEGIGEPVPIAAMPGHAQHSLESLRKEAAELAGLGIPALLLFGIPAGKDPEGSQAWAPDGIVQRALRALRADLGDDIALIADLCLCEYTDHGHCGVLGPPAPGAAVEGPVVANDPTLELYARTAVAQAEAGATVIAPSGMMDGQVAAIRAALDGAEGADMVMVKPALAYLDVLWRVKQAFGLPTAAYHVSGEYAMVKAAAERGWVDGERVMLEVLTGIRRAGADLVVTYFARDAAPLL